jgi:hypothetical protein
MAEFWHPTGDRWGMSSGGRRAGRASAAAFGVRAAASGAAGRATVCSVRRARRDRARSVSAGCSCAAQHRDLVPKRQDLGVLGGVGAGEQRQPAQYANEHQVDESEGHSGRSCWLSSGWVLLRVDSGKVLRRGDDGFLGTHSRVHLDRIFRQSLEPPEATYGRPVTRGLANR